MFHPSSQHLSLRQQVIALNQSYPCPRCGPGMLEPFGHTETFCCDTCTRHYVPLKGGRFLYPANSLGWKIAPIFWWDGYRWHWAGTTATGRQLFTIVLLSILPVIAVNLAMYFGLWDNRPEWCTPLIVSPIVGLVSINLLYLMCWDYDFLARKPRRSDDRSDDAIDDRSAATNS